MNPLAAKLAFNDERQETALEHDFPIVEISQVAEHESWRKEINRPLYHIHKWWATRLGSVFRAITLGALSPSTRRYGMSFYKRHHFTGKVILDPFMGSGTTLGEALKLGAKAIGCDINPVSTFLVRQSLTRVPEQALRDAFAQLERAVAPEIRRYYQTRIRSPGKLIPVLYFFWVKVGSNSQMGSRPSVRQVRLRPGCLPEEEAQGTNRLPELLGAHRGSLRRYRLLCPACKQQFNPQEGKASGQHVTTCVAEAPHQRPVPEGWHTLASPSVRDNRTKADRREDLPESASRRPAISTPKRRRRLATEALPLPTLAVRPGHNTDQARGYNYLHWRDFFNARQLLCLGLLLQEILRLEDPGRTGADALPLLQHP